MLGRLRTVDGDFERIRQRRSLRKSASPVSTFFFFKRIKYTFGGPFIPNDLNEPKSHIIDATNLITIDLFGRVYEEFNYDSHVYLANNGTDHIVERL